MNRPYRYEGTIYGQDRAGNFKVRSDRYLRPVVLTRSAKLSYGKGDKVYFNVTGAGEHVDFSSAYERKGTESRGEERDASVDLILADEWTKEVLIVGIWPSSAFIEERLQDIEGYSGTFTYEGGNRGRDYFHLNLQDQAREFNEAGKIAEALRVSHEKLIEGDFEVSVGRSLLGFANAVNGNEYRQQLEEIIEQHLL